MSPIIAQITNEFDMLNVADLLSVIHIGLSALVKKIEKNIPEKFINARLLQICNQYPMPNIFLDEKTGNVKEFRFNDWMKKGFHNYYTATIIKDDNIPDNSQILIWLIINSHYFKVIEIRIDGKKDSGVGRWFFNGLYKLLNESRIRSSEKEYPQDKITISNDVIQNIFLFSRVSNNKSRDWHRIREKTKSYNDDIYTELNSVFKGNIKNIPPLFQFVNSKRPSQGLIINIAECDICLINSTSYMGEIL